MVQTSATTVLSKSAEFLIPKRKRTRTHTDTPTPPDEKQETETVYCAYIADVQQRIAAVMKLVHVVVMPAV